jgi:hypothetical protein
MRISLKEASRFDILLCRIVPMPLVRPTLCSNIKRLEAEFFHGFRPSANVFYVSLCDETGEERSVTDEDQQKWGPPWIALNEEFEARLAANPHLSKLSGHMFFICNNNHRFKAWTSCIKRLHNDNHGWYYIVDNICLDTNSKMGVLLNAMHDINK